MPKIDPLFAPPGKVPAAETVSYGCLIEGFFRRAIDAEGQVFFTKEGAAFPLIVQSDGLITTERCQHYVPPKNEIVEILGLESLGITTVRIAA